MASKWAPFWMIGMLGFRQEFQMMIIERDCSAHDRSAALSSIVFGEIMDIDIV